MTLPLIHALSKASFLEKRKIISIVGSKTSDERKIQKVLDFVNEKGGLAYARQKMDEFVMKALSISESFPDSPFKSSFCDLVRYTVERDK